MPEIRWIRRHNLTIMVGKDYKKPWGGVSMKARAVAVATTLFAAELRPESFRAAPEPEGHFMAPRTLGLTVRQSDSC